MILSMSVGWPPFVIWCRGVLDFVYTRKGKQPAGQIGDTDGEGIFVVSEEWGNR